jgi:tetratricopeptide (TPR) repeat protein/tRNA A-37 threonylcarbamoyl transferase component Bud32
VSERVLGRSAPAQLVAALSDRYAIERELGRGGMATVYLARDLKHERRVALKLLDPELGVAMGVERFLAEIRVTANLQHPNVLPLFDSGSADGLLYYVMPYVDGESLRARLDREGPLAIDQALRLTSAVAAALDHAHRHGIVHRDVKPENILLSDGVPVVADFGIAKAVAESQRAGTGTALTQVGSALGTPSYMSPEQAMGEADVDARTDVYALGVLLYEMLAGELPFSGPTAHAVIAKHLMTPVPSVRTARESVPPVIDAVIARAMAKDPAARFPTAAEFAAALVMAPAVEPRPDYSQVTEPVTRTQEPLVGRRKELGELLGRLDAMEQGRGGLVLVGGEPGVGKTRLVEAVLLEARRRGHFCAVGHCYEMDGGPPYLPFVEQLEYTSRVVPPGRFRAVLGDGAAEIARIMPGLRQLFPDVPAPLDLPPDQQRHFLFGRYREYMERSTANVPVVLLFDDLHWADESTLLLLEHLAPHHGRNRVLAIGTYRDTDLDVGRPFAKSLERLMRQRLAERVVLRRMPEDDVAALLASLGAPEPPVDLVRAIYRETEGNPFFVEEVFRHLRDEGGLLGADGGWLPDIRIDELEVPEGVRLVVGRRLERVGDACRAVLTAAAVVGPRFDLKLLEGLGEADGDAILDALEQAEAAGLVLAEPVGRETRYAFAHELVRQTLLGTLSLPRRQRRHRQTADAIERAYAGKLDARAAELAYHLYQAGAAVDEERTTHWLLAAGRQALAAGAFAEALALAEKALSVLEGGSGRRHAELTLLRAEALRGLGRWSDAIADLELARASFERLGAVDESLAVTLTLSTLLTWSLQDHTRLTELLRHTLDAFPDAPAAARARLLAAAGMSMALTHGYRDGLTLAEEGVRLAMAAGDAIARADVLGMRGIVRLCFGEYAAATEDLAPAYETLTRAGRRWDAARFGAQLLQTRFYGGHVDEALSIADAVLCEAREMGHLAARFLAEYVLGEASWLRSGDAAAYDRFAREAVRTWPTAGPLFAENANLFLALSRLESDHPDPADVLEGAPERAGFEAWRDQYWAEQFRMLAYTRPERARAVLARYAHALPQPGRPAFGGAWSALVRVVDGLAALGDRAAAAALYPQCLDVPRMGLVIASGTMPFTCALGVTAACGERWDAAEAHFAQAAREAAEMRFVVTQDEVRRWHAWALLARRGPGDVERARTLLGEAVSRARSLALPRRLRLCEALLREAGV